MNEIRIIDEELSLIAYYLAEEVTLEWYQDLALCQQVDAIDLPYGLSRLQKMYHYLNNYGKLFYIQYQGKLNGDCCLQNTAELAIVISKDYQNRSIGKMRKRTDKIS